MKKRIFIYLLGIIFLSNCGFSPIYNSANNTNFKIEIAELTGNRDIYNLLKNNLKKYTEVDGEKIYKIKINTNLSKTSIAKDSTGKTTDYRIEITTNFLIKDGNILKELNFKENFDYKNIDDSLELLKYENSIKQNIANIKIQKLISFLIRIE